MQYFDTVAKDTVDMDVNMRNSFVDCLIRKHQNNT